MKIAKLLKGLRIMASALFLALLTAFFVGAPTAVLSSAEFAASVQLVPSILGFSLGTVVVWIIITLVFGRVYCSSVCPIGTLCDLFALLRFKRRYRYSPSYQYVSQVILAIVVICAIGGLSIAVGLLDPFSQWGRIINSIMHPTLAKLLIAGLAVAIIGMMAYRGGRLYCNLICPVGGALGIISRGSVFHVEIDPDRCIRCRKCVDVCKSECIEIDTCTIDSARCVTCFNCIPPCPVDAIRYTPDRKQLMTPMFRPIAPKGPKVATDSFESHSHQQQSNSDETVS